jgi:hypothetical protein
VVGGEHPVARGTRNRESGSTRRKSSRRGEATSSDAGEELTAEALVPRFSPETELERRVAADRELIEGLAWGSPRPSHPEGSVGRHVAELLETIDSWKEESGRRADLRFLALVHDSLKGEVDTRRPKTGENHHAMRARRFAERYTSDERLLSVLELHDRPYALWRRLDRTGELQEPELEAMIAAVPDPALFLRFVELDGSTPGKRDEPLVWLRGELERRGALPGS